MFASLRLILPRSCCPDCLRVETNQITVTSTAVIQQWSALPSLVYVNLALIRHLPSKAVL